MTIAIEPMVLIGTRQTRVLHDRWTVVSKNGGLTAHQEDTIAVTKNGPLVLTSL
jgi:methionyl aminopeptidase